MKYCACIQVKIFWAGMPSSVAVEY